MLHSRTDTEVLIIAVWSNHSHYLWLHIFHTSDLLTDYFDLTIGKSMYDFALGLEGYCISGIEGL